MTSAKHPEPTMPDASTNWQLWHYDTFDRDAPPYLEAGGQGILEGLYKLWLQTLKEGIQENGSASFSYFQLTWGLPPSERADLGVLPFDNTALLKLRRWARLTPQAQEERDRHASQDRESERNSMAHRLAQLHFEALQKSDRWGATAVDWGAEARKVLARVESITDPKDL